MNYLEMENNLFQKISSIEYKGLENDGEYFFLLGNAIQLLQFLSPVRHTDGLRNFRNKSIDKIKMLFRKLINENKNNIKKGTRLSNAITLLLGYIPESINYEYLLNGFMYKIFI